MTALYYLSTSFVRKTLNLSCVMDPVISTIHFICSSSLRNCQFQNVFKKIEAEYPYVPYFTTVQWLRRVKVLSNFF